VKTVEEWIQAIDGPPRSDFPVGWQGLPQVRDAHVALMRDAADGRTYASIPVNRGGGRGIVCGAGGAKFFSCAFAMAMQVRQLGCNLPIEFWHLGRHEIDQKMEALAAKFGIEVVDASVQLRINGVTPRILEGWELKPMAASMSHFDEVLYLDADCLPVQNPEALFDAQQYRDAGAAFWPDLPPTSRKEWVPDIVWHNVGLSPQRGPDFESGQFMVDKCRHHGPLRLTNFFNQHSDWYYQFVYGDKSTFNLAWRVCGMPFSMPARAAGWEHPCIVQHHWDGTPLFYHACQGKEDIVNGQMSHLPVGDAVAKAKAIRDEHWSGNIYDWSEMDQSARHEASHLIGTYVYVRESGTRRQMDLLPNGEIGVGKARCEKRWAVVHAGLDGTDPEIVVVGEAHKGSEIAMFFARRAEQGRFEGRWNAFERDRCALLKEEKSNTMPSFRPGTNDDAIWKSVYDQNEYNVQQPWASSIIDVGAHVGAFSRFAVDMLKARQVLAVEPDKGNFQMLQRNVWTAPAVECLNAAVASQSGVWAYPRGNAFPENTGGCRYDPEAAKSGSGVATVTLAGLVQRCRFRPVLVKMDCEGAEYDILSAPDIDWDPITVVLGEYHVQEGQSHEEAVGKLRTILEALGFEFSSHPTAEKLGLFASHRK
jgi:FkbM family methyltransferase